MRISCEQCLDDNENENLEKPQAQEKTSIFFTFSYKLSYICAFEVTNNFKYSCKNAITSNRKNYTKNMFYIDQLQYDV